MHWSLLVRGIFKDKNFHADSAAEIVGWSIFLSFEDIDWAKRRELKSLFGMKVFSKIHCLLSEGVNQCLIWSSITATW